MDPSPQDLTAIHTVEDAKNWVGISPELWTGFSDAIGHISLVRDIATVPAIDWEIAINATVISSAGTAGSDGTPTTTSLAIRGADKGRLIVLRRVARLVFGLDPSEAPTQALASSAPGAVAAIVPDPSRTEPTRCEGSWVRVVRKLLDIRWAQQSFAWSGHYLQRFPKSIRERVAKVIKQ
jgi:hypothetical protein